MSSVNAIGAIRAILQDYPFSGGILRELLQNSDDSKASKQLFVLDNRTYIYPGSLDLNLAELQGPALLAYNDSYFTPEDWGALGKIYESSKRVDTSKIGKYGMGFISCNHITDTPQVLSGTRLRIVDPCDKVLGGAKHFDVVDDSPLYTDLTIPFKSMSEITGPSPTRSIIRLPLRKTPSDISTKVVEPSDIRQLLVDFIREEMDIATLFLKNVTSIEVHEIDQEGKSSLLAVSTTTRSPKPFQPFNNDQTSALVCSIRMNNAPSPQEWYVLDTLYSQDTVVSTLSKKTRENVNVTLSKHKLEPRVTLAVPLSILFHKESEITGRLFTYLPLPLLTGFPVNIHGLFALTQSRQHLRNAHQNGLVQGTDDAILVEWNKLLFAEYIPRTWAALLSALPNIDVQGPLDIFRAWPPTHESNPYDDGYWRDMALHLVRELWDTDFCVWPVLGFSDHKYLGLKSVLVLTDDDQVDVAEILSTFGLKITHPPRYIAELLVHLGAECLTPESAHGQLKQHTTQLERAPRSKILTILRYLTSNGCLTNIIGLPVVPVSGGGCIALTPSSSAPHTMFNKLEYEVFGPCDSDAVLLHELEPVVAEMIATRGPGVLNLQRLTPERVVEYLTLYPNPLGLTLGTKVIDPSVIEWLMKFWTWLGAWRFKLQLYPLITNLYLVPSRKGLRSTGYPVHIGADVHPLLLSGLESLGVSFLHPQFSTRDILKSFRTFSNLNDIHSLLGSVASDRTEVFDLAVSPIVLGHFTQCARGQPLSIEERQKLRDLPIFPTIPQGQIHNGLNVWGAIPEGKQIIAIYAENRTIIPVTQNIVFLDGSKLDASFVQLLDPSAGRHFSENDLLAFTLEHFTAQSEETQAAYVKYMVGNRHRISQRDIEILQANPFVLAQDNHKHSPKDLVDPSSCIAPLFPEVYSRHPKDSDQMQKQLIDNLRSLDLLQNSLTIEIVMWLIDSISSHAVPRSHQVARELLDVVFETNFDCLALTIPVEKKWLPTGKGLLAPHECFDPRSKYASLCDQVLSPLDENVRISRTLRSALGWDRSPPHPILIQQLSCILGQVNSTQRLLCLIEEFSCRDIKDLNSIKVAISGRPWIPVTTGQFAKTSDAVFSGEEPSVGFYRILFTPYGPHHAISKFLRRMGCSESPSLDAVLEKLKFLQKLLPTEETAKKALLLLALLPPSLSPESRSEVLVPDTTFQLLPIASVYYNDIAERIDLVNLNGLDIRLAHQDLKEELARSLGLDRLGLRFSGLSDPEEDMGEELATTIRRTLREYTPRQIFSEFLANAADAGATVFGVLVDQHHHPDQNILSPNMAKYQSCPSLLIYNNSTFSDADFHGIIRTGIGGKGRNSQSIGQFGLGALTMFHFTELAMVVSGSKVLFLNPSKDSLPMQSRASVLLSLESTRRFYPGHLACIHNLYRFDQYSTDYYDGTIFRLPLRNRAQLRETSILQKTWALCDIEEIIQPFASSVHEYMLFTKVTNITVRYHASSTGLEKVVEVVSQTHDLGSTPPAEYQTRVLDITTSTGYQRQAQKWKVFTKHLPRELLRKDFSSLGEKYRLRSPGVVGLACQLDRELKSPECKLFSTLPLPQPTTLPVHLTAPFILSSDRRQIRLDKYDNSESEYNQWLLSSVVPPLYLCLLEDLLGCGGDNWKWWPGNNKEEDSITRTLVTSFYATYLKASDKAIIAGERSNLLPGNAVILGKGLPKIFKEILTLADSHQVVRPPPKISRRLIQETKLADVTPLFVKEEIIRDSRSASKITSQVGLDDLHVLLEFIRKGKVEDLIGLPLLPLADGSFGLIEGAAACTKTFFIWENQIEDLFLRNHLVHPKFPTATFSDASALNVEPITASAIKTLVGECLREVDELTETDNETQNWIATFWTEFWRLPRGADITSFPLIQTLSPGQYISIRRCKDRSVVVLMDSSENQIPDLLAQLGLTVVQRGRCPEALIGILSKDCSLSEFREVLLALKVIESNILERFSRLSANLQETFAKWVRSKIVSGLPPELLSVVRKLPIWPASQGRQLSADTLIMLPSGFHVEAALRFLDLPLVTHTYLLECIDANEISQTDFAAKLEGALPKILTREDIVHYKKLLSKMISPGTGISSVLVPNYNGIMRKSNKLYARDALFSAAFGAQSKKFTLEEYRDLEPGLYGLGLRRQEKLDIDMFKKCALAIQKDIALADGGIEGRAGIVYRVYSEDLPLRVQSYLQVRWKELDSIRFIPRGADRRGSLPGMDLSDYIRPLPSIVSPNELLLGAHEAFAWTQRAQFLEPPSERVLIANPGLGRPTTEDVVNHLVVLALKVCRDHPSDPRVLHDVKETYGWLQEHSTEATKFIVQHHEQKIFLNVADPASESWIWHSADELLLEADEDMGSFYTVKPFLSPFRDLLLVSGVGIIKHSEMSVPQASQLGEALQLKQMRSVFQQMRLGRKLTDVVFEALDGESFYAHRLLLAACSTHFENLFTGNVGIERDENACVASPVHVKVDHSSRCLELVLDYAYTGVIPIIGKGGWEILLEMIMLSDYWNFKSLHAEAQRMVIELRIIRPDRLKKIRDSAELAQAHLVVEACVQYERDNKALIRRVIGY